MPFIGGESVDGNGSAQRNDERQADGKARDPPDRFPAKLSAESNVD